MTTNTKQSNQALLKLLSIYGPKLAREEEETYASLAGVAYVSTSKKTGRQYLAFNRNAEEYRYNKRVELPKLCPLDNILGQKWRESVIQIEGNFEEGCLSLETILEPKTGPNPWELGLCLKQLGRVEVRVHRDSQSLYVGKTKVAISKGVGDPKKASWSLDSFGITGSAIVLGHLLDQAKRAMEISLGFKTDYLTVHPGWIGCNRSLRYNLVLTKKVGTKSRSLLEVAFGRMGIPEADQAKVAIRFGKDALSETDSFRTLTIKLHAEKEHAGNKDMLCDDGVIFVKSFPGLNPGEFGLVRGTYRTKDGRTGIVKARIVVNWNIAMANPDDDEMYLDTSIDGWSRLGQFKFAPVEAGELLEISIGLKKDESAEGEKDFFSINQAMTYVGKFDDRSKEKFRALISSQVEETATTPMTSLLDKDLAKIFCGTDATVNADMAKFVIGMKGAWNSDQNDRWVSRRLKNAYAARSRDILRIGVCVTDSVAYVDIVHGSNGEPVFKRVVRKVSEGVMLVSEKLAERLGKVGNAPITITRDPVLTATSYLDHSWNREFVPGFMTRFAFISAVAGPDLGADCDDFTKILIGYKSLVKPGTVPAIEKHCTELDVNGLSAGAIYCWGYVAQAMVGAYVNCLHCSILFGADPNSGNAMEIAQACQALVQAIKKPVVPSIEFDRAKEIARSYQDGYAGSDKSYKEALWKIVRKGEKVEEKREAVKEVFGVDISFEERIDRPKVTLSAPARKISSEIFNRYFLKGSKVNPTLLSRELVDTLVQVHGIDLVTAEEEQLRIAARDYYAFFSYAFAVLKGNKIDAVIDFCKLDVALKLANGAVLYWGATSYQSKEDIFLQALRALERRSSVAED